MCVVLPGAGGGSGQEAEVAAGTSPFPQGSFATRWVGWDGSSSRSHAGKIQQGTAAGDLTPVSLVCGSSQSAVAAGCAETILRKAHGRGQGNGFALGNLPWASGGRGGPVPGAESDVSVPWKGQGGKENRCLGRDERPPPSASSLIWAACV